MKKKMNLLLQNSFLCIGFILRNLHHNMAIGHKLSYKSAFLKQFYAYIAFGIALNV